MSWVNRVVRAFEIGVFGDYTGTPEAQREFIRRRLIGMGYRPSIVDRVLHEEFAIVDWAPQITGG